jgi:hypothetical protein
MAMSQVFLAGGLSEDSFLDIEHLDGFEKQI